MLVTRVIGIDIPLPLSLTELLAVSVLLVGVGLVKGTLGFGSGLLSVPIVMQFLPPKLAIAVLTVPLWLGNIPVLLADAVPRERYWHERELFVFLCLFSAVGLLALEVISARIVALLLGGYLIVFLLSRHGAVDLTGHFPSGSSAALSGTIGGFLNGAVLSGGPVFVSYFHAKDLHKDDFAVLLSTVFFLAMSIRLSGLYLLGQLPVSTVGLGVVFIVPITTGAYAGTTIRPRIPLGRFRVVVNGFLLVMALKLLSDGLVP